MNNCNGISTFNGKSSLPSLDLFSLEGRVAMVTGGGTGKEVLKDGVTEKCEIQLRKSHVTQT